jgi:DNA repair photolyase
MAREEDKVAAVAVREVACKGILSESGICDYALNCYTGCEHACIYCYARFMGRFHHPDKPWGRFVDVKTNAPQVLARQLRAKGLFASGSVFVSSVCDAYQPLERTYRLTRQCLELLLPAGMTVHIQTKNELVRRDYDLLSGHENASVCLTITTLDAAVTARIEPAASPPAARLAALEEAARAGIPAKAFVGPLLPGLTDGEQSLTELLARLAGIGLAEVYVDRLNLRWGVWPAMAAALAGEPEALRQTKAVLFSPSEGRQYNRALRVTVREAAEKAGLTAPMNVLF